MKQFRNMKVHNKLFLVFGVLVFIAVILSAVSIRTISRTEDIYINLLEGTQKRIAYLSDAAGELNSMRRYLLCMVFVVTDTDEVEEYRTLFGRSSELFLQYYDKYYESLENDISMPVSEKDKQKSDIADIKNLFCGGFETYAEAVYQSALTRDLDKADTLFSDGIKLGDIINWKLVDLRADVQKTTDELCNEVLSLSHKARISVAAISLLIAAFATAVPVLMSRVIITPLADIVTAVSEIAGGNLTYPIRSEYKDEIGILSNNISDMVDTMVKLKQSMAIVDNMNDMIFVTDLDCNLIYYNSCMAEKFGADIQSALRKKCYELMSDCGAPCLFCPLTRLSARMHSLPSLDWERRITVNGNELWLANRSSIIRWVDGSLVHMCVCKDDTVRKEREEQLLKFEKERTLAAKQENDRILVIRQSLQMVLDALPVPVRIVDLENNDIVYVNDSLVLLLGYESSDEVVGLKLKDILPETAGDGTPSANLIDMTLNSENLISFDVDYKTKTGKVIEAILSTRHIEYKGRRSSIGIIRDLTAEKEQARILRQAAESEKESNRSKSMFLANMSHEIRTPMNGIIGFSELALADDVSSKTRDYLCKIKSSSESLLQIINDILDVSKIEAGKMTLEEIPFDLNEVFNLCRVIILPKASEKGISLLCHAEPPGGRTLVGDPTRLRQVLLNLLSNAVKFTNNGAVKLISGIEKIAGDSVTMRFVVKDSGIGMTPMQLEKIFEPFVQAEEGATRRFGGTGLGLAITKNIVELMGGSLQTNSAIGIGSKFSFALTFKTIDKRAENAASMVNTAGFLRRPGFEGEILVCEDNELNRQVVCDHLARVGIKTIIAENGRSCVEQVKRRIRDNEKPFDLIFMDIHMPVMDGLEASRKLAELGNKSPVIALTANIMASDRELYQSAGMEGCIAKPFSTQELWSCLYRYFKPVGMDMVSAAELSAEEQKHREMMMVNFVQNNQTTFTDIYAAARTGNIKLAYRLVHTLKGVAGAIGMTALYNAAEIIEQSLADGKAGYTGEQMNRLEAEINSALDELAPLAIKIRDEGARVEIGMGDALALLDKLDSLLEADSFESLLLMGELAAIPGTETLIGLLEKVKFKEAREALAHIKNNLRCDNAEQRKI